MASEVKANKLTPSSGTDLTLGDASDTVIVPTGATINIVDGVPVASGGTGLASFTVGDILYATGSTTLAKLGKGTGLQGLQTNSGATAPEWANSPQSLMTAEGDIVYASGANTLAKLAKGSDDDVLTLASGVPSWAAAAAGGKIAQIVQTTNFSTETWSTATATTISNFTVTITPAATTSKILIIIDAKVATDDGYNFNLQLFRDTTQVYMGDAASNRPRIFAGTQMNNSRHLYNSFGCYLDSPSTTSAVAYSLKGFTEGSRATYLNRTVTDNDETTYQGRYASSITAIEVSA